MSWLIWLLLGGALIFSETLIPGLVAIFFGMGALLSSVLVAIFPELGLPLQLLVWLGGSFGSLVFLRKKLKKTFRGRLYSPNDDGLQYIGRTAVVVEEISPGKSGRVRIDEVGWNAISLVDTFNQGDQVVIADKQGLTMTVIPLAELEEAPDNSIESTPQ